MGKRSIILFLAMTISLLFLTSPIFSEEADININIKVNFFKGMWNESQKGIGEEIIMTSSSHPEMACLNEIVSDPEQEYIAAIMEALIETMDLKTVEEWGGGLKGYEWLVTETSFQSSLARGEVAFQFILIPKRISNQKFCFKTIVNRTKDSYVDSIKEKDKGHPGISAVVRGYVDEIFNRELIVNVDE